MPDRSSPGQLLTILSVDRYHIDLKQQRQGSSSAPPAPPPLLPVAGGQPNVLSVALVSRDAKMVDPVEVVDVQVVIEYLAHKNGIRDDEDFYDV